MNHNEFIKLCKESPYVCVKPEPKGISQARAYREGLAAVKTRGNPAYKDNGKWGYFDTGGNMVIPAEFEEAEKFHNSYAVVKQNCFAHIIDKKGDIVLETRCSKLRFDEHTAGLVYAMHNGHWGLIDLEHNDILPYDYSVIGHFVDGLALVEEEFNNPGTKSRLRSNMLRYYGYVNTKGEMAIPIGFDEALDFDSGCAEVRRGDKWGLIDKEGNVVLPFEYDGLRQRQGTVLFLKGEKWGIMDIGGNVRVQPQFDIVYLREKDLIVVKRDGLFGIVASDGSEIVPVKYDDIMPYDWDAAPPYCVKLGGKYGYVDGSGAEVIPFIYDEGGRFDYGRAAVDLGGKTGMIDEGGNTVIPFEYLFVTDTYENLTIAFRHPDNNICLLDGSEIVLKLPDCSVDGFEEGISWLNYGGTHFAIGEPE